MTDLNKIKKELEKNSKLNVKQTSEGDLEIDSDYWGEIPSDNKKPTVLQVYKTEKYIKVNALDTNYKRERLDTKTAIKTVEGLLKGNDIQYLTVFY